jgi:predicted nucleotidyltransferase
MNPPSAAHPNTLLLDTLVGLLGDLVPELVFVGGCATELLVTAVRAESVRVTRDVDVVAAATTLREYHVIEARLRKLGFAPDPEVVCRWKIAGLQLDLLPSGPDVLSFHNRWYPEVMRTAVPRRLPSGRTIRILTSPLFLATKLDAFQSRGNGDFLASHDLEDIITVIDGRPELADEVTTATQEIRDYLQRCFADLLRQEAFLTALPGHLPGDASSQSRLPGLLETLRRLAHGITP